MKCPRCAQENPPQAKFCLECGTRLSGAGTTHDGQAQLQNDDLRRALAEAAEQQAATAEILRVISRSPSNLQPVLDAIATNAALVCDAYDAVVFLREGDRLRDAAHYGPITITVQHATLSRGSITEAAILDRQPVHVHDVLAAEQTFPLSAKAARAGGFRTALSAPLLRENEAIGALAIRRREVQPFTTQQIELLRTFADQAVIAIENVRLLTELQEKNTALTQAHARVTESLEQQTATSEVLRIIAAARELRPVFDAISLRAATLCAADIGAVVPVEGGLFTVGGNHGFPEALRRSYPRPVDTSTINGRAILERRTIHVPDFDAPDAPDSAVIRDLRQAPLAPGTRLFRSQLSVPMLRGDEAIGVMVLARYEPKAFSEAQIELLKTFADQAVIAIENVRLFTELQASNRELTSALDTQTATSEILRAISSSLTDAQPVFDTIVRSGLRLLGGYSASMMLLRDDDRLDLAAYTSTSVGADSSLVDAFPMPLHRLPPGERAIRERYPHAVEDVGSAPDVTDVMRETGRARGWRSNVFVPMLRDNVALGLISITRREPGPFAADQIALLEIFAAQAVIAIENVRLFKELEVANRDLKAASQHKSEFLANMSHELRTPLNAVIGFSEVLSERMFGELNEKQADYLKDIHASGQHLLSLINDILDLSKIEAGKTELALSDFDLPSTIDNALTLVRERAGRRGIELQRTVDERLGQIQADERKLRQVLLNLLSNAIKFTPEGGRIEVRAVPIDQGVEVSVIDTGVGIAPEDQRAIFEEFKQVGMASQKVEGTGLGLTLSRRFIELHGGQISVKSEVGAGSTFTFTLPMRVGD